MRGRKRIPDEVKALKGNPGKRRLVLREAAAEPVDEPAEAEIRAPLAMPEFLTEPREQEIFRRIMGDQLHRRIARATDVIAYARWAVYVSQWIACRDELKGKSTYYRVTNAHGESLRRHPAFKDQLDLERCMQALEDRLGLSPTARQNIIRGLSAMPAALGEFLADEPRDLPATVKQVEPEVSPAPIGPLGYLQNAGKRFN